MTTYICKCGRQVKKATNADNTGNRDTEGCKGCPYLLPWGPDKYIEGQGFTKDVQGYECRMSPTISYTTTYLGQANDKCTLRILSLDLDFLDEVQAWIHDNAADTLSAGFSRGSMRGTDFSDKGRYSLSISCTQNKKGMAAKAALLDMFFTGGRVRKDKTLVQEKAHILAAIKEGKENASKMNYIISQHDNGLLYAYYLGTFWFWLADKRWVPSDFAKQEYEKAQKKNPRITPEQFMDSDDFIQMDDYEVPSQKLSALKALTTADSKISAPDEEEGVLPSSNETPEIVDECSEPDCMCRTCGRESCFAHGCAKECPANAEESCLTVNCPEYIERTETTCNCQATVAQTGAAAATTDGSAAPEPSQAAETTTTSESGADADTSMSLESGTSGPSTSPARGFPAGTGDAASGATPAASPVTTPSSLPAFDYTGLDAQTVQDLHLAEREFAGGKRMAEIGLRRMADGVAIAHDALCGTDATLCRNGDGTFTAPEKTFGRWCESVGLNRKAAERLLQVSKLFDNSSPRQQKALEELGPTLLYAAAKPSAPAELVQAVKDGDITTHKQYQDLLARYDAEKAAREKAEKAAKAMTECYNTAHKNEESTLKNMKKAQDERDTALRRAAEAEKQRDGARDALAAAKLRGDKLKAENDALKAHPIEAQVVDEEEIDRRAQARANELTAPLREELEALRNRHPADLEEAEQAIRDAYDSAVYTGRVIESAWRSLCPLLPRMDADRRELALNQIVKIISTIQGECIQCL